MKKTFFIIVYITICLSVFGYDFQSEGICYNIIGNNEVEVTSGLSYSGAIVIPPSVTFNSVTYDVTSIGFMAFDNCSDMTSVTIPEGVTSIEMYAFGYCTGLTSVTIPDGVTSIGVYAFGSCTGLTSVTMPSSVTYLGSAAFHYCINLTSVTIPKCALPLGTHFSTIVTDVAMAAGVDSIYDNAFSSYAQLTSVTIPNSVTYIGEQAFGTCTGLTSITIPENVAFIADNAFRSCYNLVSISVAANNANYDSRGNCNAIIETATNTLIQGCNNTVIPNNVTSIRDCAFTNCTGLTSVTFPSCLTHIGNYAFNYCSGMTEITCQALTPPTVEEFTFTNFNPTLYVPASSISQYSARPYWKNFYIQPIPGGSIGGGDDPAPETSYTITVNSSNSQMGIALGGGTFDENTSTQLIAAAKAGYLFRQWNDGNTDNPRSVVVTGDSSFMAVFAAFTVTHDTIVRVDTVYSTIHDTVFVTQTDTVYLEYDGTNATQYSLEDYGVYYVNGMVYNQQNLYIKLYYSDGKLISSGQNDIDMSGCVNGIYIVTDGKGGFLKVSHCR